jgi:type II secretory ATPase GspE/PulE/Tfp pilus assembly ATPase PilB-like protein
MQSLRALFNWIPGVNAEPPAPLPPRAQPKLLPLIPPVELEGRLLAYEDGLVLRTVDCERQAELAAIYTHYRQTIVGLLGDLPLREEVITHESMEQLRPAVIDFNDLVEPRSATLVSDSTAPHRQRALKLLAQAAGRRISDVFLKVDPHGSDSYVNFQIDGSEDRHLDLSYSEANSIHEGLWAMAADIGFGNTSHSNLGASSYQSYSYQGPDLPPGLISFRGQIISDREITVVLRLVRTEKVPSIDEQGDAPDVVERVRRLTRKPHGAILVCGTMGDGKTTEAYAVMEELFNYKKSIGLVQPPSSAEDPVEIYQPYFYQQTNCTTDAAWRNMMIAWRRQARKLVLIGEIRQLLQAQIVPDAATFGCQVVSTLHVPRLLMAFKKLKDMGLSADMLREETAWAGLIGRRLVPVLCEKCSTPWFADGYTPGPLDAAIRRLGLHRVARRRGVSVRSICPPSCHKGAIGRRPLTEVLDIDREILEAFLVDDLKRVDRLWRAQGATRIADQTIAGILDGNLDPLSASVVVDLERLDPSDLTQPLLDGLCETKEAAE